MYSHSLNPNAIYFYSSASFASFLVMGDYIQHLIVLSNKRHHINSTSSELEGPPK